MRRYVVAGIVASVLISMAFSALRTWNLLPYYAFESVLQTTINVAQFRPPEATAVPTPEESSACAQALTKFLSNQLVMRRYFPDQIFYSADGDDLRKPWYSNSLCAMQEPSLSAPGPGEYRVRFLWLRSFHPAVAIRAESNPPRIFAVQLRDSETGSPEVRTERSLSESEIDRVGDRLMDAGFWNLRALESEPYAFDGARWVVEVSEYNRYHVVDRLGPRELDAIGRLLIELSGLQPNAIY